MAVDPADPQTWNMYAYVGDNPATLNDPSGLDWVWSGNCAYDQTSSYVSIGNGPEIPTGAFINYSVGVCSGIADGDQSAPAVVPDTSYQYRNLNAMYVAAQAAAAPNNAGSPKPTVPQRVGKFVCKGSPADRVWASFKQGAVVGAIRGGASGFVGGELTEPLGGGIPGALLGGFLGGTIGAGGGIFSGSAIAIGCSLAGAYKR